ncbi:hypothetical protein Golob_004196 [Gossypium lobatum]|uniref:Uncharacterized protein n=1 Tax=Gossypium lobatum TaxID=34289 RepID=A0A7J8N0Q1_9ROSI|nr:hypothetical protein [Gossypium lobatum]
MFSWPNSIGDFIPNKVSLS